MLFRSIRVRDNDEFQDLIEMYNYFYESTRTQILRDYRSLSKFKIEPMDRDSFLAWQFMLQEKGMQLNIESHEALFHSDISETSSKPDQPHVKPHAS